MQKTFYLHVGMPKTGTSSIQYFLAKNKDLLLEKGLFYPNFFNEVTNTLRVKIASGNGHTISRVLQDSETKTKNQSAARIMQLIKKNLMECGENNFLLSSEGLYRIKDNYGTQLMEFANKFGFQFKVIIYLRRQDLALTSMYNQKVKRSKFTLPFEEWLVDNYKKEPKFNYHKLLHKHANVFGKENIIVVPFEKQQLLDGDLIKDFLSHLNMELSEDFNLETGLQNPSLSAKSVTLMNALNTLEPTKTFTNYIMEAEKTLSKVAPSFGVKQAIKPEIANQIMAYFQEENELTAKEFLGREDGILFKDEIKSKATTDQTSFSTEEVALLLGGLMISLEKKIRNSHKKIDILMKERNMKLRKLKNNSDVENHTNAPKAAKKRLKKGK